MTSVPDRTGRMIAIVWDWAADCSTRVVLRRRRSYLQNCCMSNWQRVFEYNRSKW